MVARLLCHTHYNQTHVTVRHARRRVVCAFCQVTYTTVRPSGRFCSERCYGLHRRQAAGAIAPWVRPSDWEARVRASLPQPRPLGRILTAGCCPICGTWFVSDNGDRTCSSACRRTRRYRRGRPWITPADRAAVYARDDYTCQLCLDPLLMTAGPPHPLSPTIDHIVARANGGTDVDENLQAAHFICNCMKRDLAAPPASPAPMIAVHTPRGKDPQRAP